MANLAVLGKNITFFAYLIAFLIYP